jgi:DNA-binding beta-propeller fold protein YncE
VRRARSVRAAFPVAAAAALLGLPAASQARSAESGQAAAASSGPIAYVTGDLNRVFTFNTGTNKFGPTIALPSSVALTDYDELAITPDGSTVWVAADGNGSLSGALVPLDTATNTAGTPITLTGTTPVELAITPDGKTAYVANEVGSGGLIPVNLTTRTPGATISLDGHGVSGAAPVSVTVSPDGKKVYVGVESNGGEYIVPVATATNTAGTPIGPVDIYPTSCAIAPNGATLYCVDGGYPPPGGPGVLPVTTKTGTVGSLIALGGEAVSLAISPTAKLAYAVTAGAGTISPIALPAGTPTSPISEPSPLNGLPEEIAFTPQAKTAYLQVGNEIQKLTVATGALATPVPAPGGGSAAELAIAPDQAPVASFTVTPAHAGSATSFDASASTSKTSPITKYSWLFGDGSAAVVTTTPTTTHVYANAGTYTATLTLTDRGGTSTKLVFTGQTVSRNGGPQAKTARQLTVPA